MRIPSFLWGGFSNQSHPEASRDLQNSVAQLITHSRDGVPVNDYVAYLLNDDNVNDAM